MGEGATGGGGGGEAKGVGGGKEWSAGDKGRQMGQTMGLRHPPCMSTTPTPFRLHLFCIIKLRGGGYCAFFARTLNASRPPSRTFLILPSSDKGQESEHDWSQLSPVVLKVDLRSASRVSTNKLSCVRVAAPSAPSRPTLSHLPGPPGHKGQLSSLCLA